MKTGIFKIFTTVFFLISLHSFAQDNTSTPDSASLQLQFPDNYNWNILQEGQKLEFRLSADTASESNAAATDSLGVNEHYTFTITEGKTDEMSFDSLGNFSWTPSFDFVDRLSTSKNTQVAFEVRNSKNQTANKVIEFKVLHVNRPPVAGDLKPFYVQYNVMNTYMIDMNSVRDEDNDPQVFIPIPDAMPEGAKLSAQPDFQKQSQK